MKNAAVKREIASLRRRTHAMLSEMEAAVEQYEGMDLVSALNRISLEYQSEDVV